MTFIGDLHLKLGIFRFLNPRKSYLQLGDFGFGFGDVEDIPSNVKFIRGNHDDPVLCVGRENYLGDFGYIQHLDIFFLSGARSVDWDDRKDESRFVGEELTDSQLWEAYTLYSKVRPKIVVSHDCPCSVSKAMFPYLNHAETRTGTFLTKMLNTHRPEIWLFGHYHHSKKYRERGTQFICLGESVMYEIRGLEWDEN